MADGQLLCLALLGAYVVVFLAITLITRHPSSR
jgi:hypothetical protein